MSLKICDRWIISRTTCLWGVNRLSGGVGRNVSRVLCHRIQQTRIREKCQNIRGEWTFSLTIDLWKEKKHTKKNFFFSNKSHGLSWNACTKNTSKQKALKVQYNLGTGQTNYVGYNLGSGQASNVGYSLVKAKPIALCIGEAKKYVKEESCALKPVTVSTDTML